VNAAKAKPGSINWGHAGIGSGTHLNTEKFVDAAKINVTQVPFKGTPEVVQAMLSGSVDCYGRRSRQRSRTSRAAGFGRLR